MIPGHRVRFLTLFMVRIGRFPAKRAGHSLNSGGFEWRKASSRTGWRDASSNALHMAGIGNSILMGVDHVAVDATCCRLMRIAPERVDYLRRASMFLGNLTTDRIDQRAEKVAGHETDFRVIDDFASLKIDPTALPG